MIDQLLDAIPDDIEVLLRSERPLPSVPADVSSQLWNRVAHSVGIAGLGGTTLLALLILGATALGGGALLLHRGAPSHGPASQASVSPPSASAVVSQRSADAHSRTLQFAEVNQARATDTAALASWPGWFGQRDVAPRTIAGTVLIDGRPAAGVSVLLTSVAAYPDEQARTDDNGMFAFAPHPAWRYVIAASRAGYSAPFDEIDLRDPAQDVAHRTLSLMACASHASGRVLDEAGNAIVGAAVQLEKDGLRADTLTTDASGAYELCGPGGDTSILVAAPGFGTQLVTLGGIAQDIVLHAGAVLAGTVQDADGVPLADVQVNLWPVAGQQDVSHLSARSDDQGHYRFEGIEPGAYTLNAWGANHTVTNAIHFTAVSGVTSSLDVSMEETYEVRGILTAGGAPLAGQWVGATLGNVQSFNALTQLDGSFTLSGVLAGSVDLTVRGRQVLAPQHVDVDPDVPTTIRLELVTANDEVPRK